MKKIFVFFGMILFSIPLQASVLQEALGIGDELAFKTSSAQLENLVDEFVGKAVQESPLYLVAKARLEVAIVRSSASIDPFLPTLNAVGDVYRRDSTIDEMTSKSDSSSGSLRFGWNLYHGGADLLSYEKNSLEVQNAELDLNAVRMSLSQTIKQSLFRYNQAQMRLLLSDLSLQNSKVLLDLSQKKNAAGIVGGIDVMEAQMQDHQAQAALSGAQVDIEVARRSLQAHIAEGMQSSAGYLSLLEKTSKLALPVGVPAKIDMRPLDIRERSAQLDLEIADKNLSLARRSRYLPSLDFLSNYSLGWRKEDLQDDPRGTVQQKQKGLAFGLELNIPLYSAKADSGIYEAKVNQLVEQANASKTSFDAEQRWQMMVANFEALNHALPIYRKAYESAVELYDARLQLYKAGAADMFAVTNAESGRLNALQRWFDARSEVQNARLSLDAAAQGLIIGDQRNSFEN